jgi:hypothetical protein
VITSHKDELIFFTIFAIESDLGSDLSGFGIDAEGLGLADILVVDFEEISEEETNDEQIKI